MLLPLAVELRATAPIALNEVLRQAVLLISFFIVLALAGAALSALLRRPAGRRPRPDRHHPAAARPPPLVLPRWGPRRLRSLRSSGCRSRLRASLGILYLRMLVV